MHVLPWSSVDRPLCIQRPARQTSQAPSTSAYSVLRELRVMNQTTPVLLSLTIHFIHKPKILQRQPIGWEGRDAKRRRALASQWLKSSTLSPSRFRAPSLTLSHILFSLALSLSLPQWITAVKTARLESGVEKPALYFGDGWDGWDSWTRRSTYTCRVDCTCSDSLLNPLRGQTLSGDLVLCSPLGLAICLFC